MGKLVATALIGALICVACARPSITDPSEVALAEQAQGIAQDVVATSDAHFEGWLQHLFDQLRHTEDPEARACLAEAHDLRQQAAEAVHAGDIERAHGLLRQAFLKVLCAVVEVFPDAPERTALAVDEAIARIEHFLVGHQAPQIREILDHVKGLRNQGDAALAAGDEVGALALNLEAFRVLHRLAVHMRDHHTDHGAAAELEMASVTVEGL